MQKESKLFSEEEVAALSRWIKKYISVLKKDTYEKGALFFLKLGKGKDKLLKDKTTIQISIKFICLQITILLKFQKKVNLEYKRLKRMCLSFIELPLLWCTIRKFHSPCKMVLSGHNYNLERCFECNQRT